jgi:hypothetical protein
MMKAILGSAIGGAVAGAIALVASAQGRTAPEPVWAAQPASPYAMTVADTRALNAAATQSPTFVQCEPHQEAVLQRSIAAGREVAQVTCVTRVAAAQPAYAAAPAYSAAPGYYPAPVAYPQPDIVERPVARTQTVRPRATRVSSVQAREEVEPKRSWKKTALIIGGSAGAGAGVGAIAGGKKGALIGAAFGGGAASIYEAVKRK